MLSGSLSVMRKYTKKSLTITTLAIAVSAGYSVAAEYNSIYLDDHDSNAYTVGEKVLQPADGWVYECTNVQCNNPGMGPGSGGNFAWEKVEKVQAVYVDPNKKVYPQWSEVDLKTYNSTSIVKSHEKLYKCTDKVHVSGWCSVPGYEPGSSPYWSMAWSETDGEAPVGTTKNGIDNNGAYKKS